MVVLAFNSGWVEHHNTSNTIATIHSCAQNVDNSVKLNPAVHYSGICVWWLHKSHIQTPTNINLHQIYIMTMLKLRYLKQMKFNTIIITVMCNLTTLTLQLQSGTWHTWHMAVHRVITSTQSEDQQLLILVLDSQPAHDISDKPGNRLILLSNRVTFPAMRHHHP